MLDLKGLTRAEVLATLYNASRPQGMGFLQYKPEPMTVAQAQELLDTHPGKERGRIYFDYLQGRVMKLNLSTDPIDPILYDRDNGQGAAQTAIDAYAAGQQDRIQEMHRQGTLDAAGKARDGMNQSMTVSSDGQMATVRLGLSDAKEALEPKVQEAIKDK